MRVIPNHVIARKEEFLSKIKIIDSGCWEWIGSGGWRCGWYGIFRGYTAHRISYQIHKGDPYGKLVLHSCDYPPCVNPAHLRLGTHQDNMDDARSRRRIKHKVGPDNPAAKLTHEQLKELIQFYTSDKSISISEAGRKFAISPCAAANYLKFSKVEIRKPFKVNTELEKKILELYDKDKTTMKSLAKELNIGVKGIVNVLKRNNIERKSYQMKAGHKNEMRWGNKSAKSVDI